MSNPMRMPRTDVFGAATLRTNQSIGEISALPEISSHAPVVADSHLTPINLASDFLRSAVKIIRPGDVVVEIGCGRGERAMALGRLTGPQGSVIGIESSPEAITQARKNAAEAGQSHLEFFLCRIDSIPLPAAAANCVLSEGIACSAAGKMAVFREIFRALKPGGRMLIHDIAVKKLLPPEIADSMAEYACGLAGAIEMSSFKHITASAGFDSVRVSEWDLKHRIYCLWDDAPALAMPKTVRFNNGNGSVNHKAHFSDAPVDQSQDHWLSEYITGVRLEAIKPLA
jgi:ubiquinone/menaquinone biosynthesis C-methylase UbiE